MKQPKPAAEELDLTNARWTDTGGVEVGFVDAWVLLRNVEEPDVILVYDHDEWDAFVKGARAGEFDDI